jgi:uncharacterized damage-inducible protein DinB
MPENQGQDLPERSFAWWDMFITPDEDPRAQEPISGERAILEAYLRNHRLTLELKCAGLDAAALARRSVEPSNLSLLGLVRHVTDGERYWFRQVMAGQEAAPLYRTEADSNADFNGALAEPELVARAWQNWRDEVAFAEQLVAQAPDLGVTGTGHDGPVSLREVLVHQIEEYARHNGHADFLRERIDGRVGQ